MAKVIAELKQVRGERLVSTMQETLVVGGAIDYFLSAKENADAEWANVSHIGQPRICKACMFISSP